MKAMMGRRMVVIMMMVGMMMRVEMMIMMGEMMMMVGMMMMGGECSSAGSELTYEAHQPTRHRISPQCYCINVMTMMIQPWVITKLKC